MKSTLNFVRLLSILSLIVPVAAKADSGTAITNAVSSDASPAPAPVAKKHHHHKKTPAPAARAPVGSSAHVPPTNASLPPIRPLGTGINENNGAGSAGAPNMGTGDHVPGTSGTSGQ